MKQTMAAPRKGRSHCPFQSGVKRDSRLHQRLGIIAQMDGKDLRESGRVWLGDLHMRLEPPGARSHCA